MFIAKNFIVQN